MSDTYSGSINFKTEMSWTVFQTKQCYQLNSVRVAASSTM